MLKSDLEELKREHPDGLEVQTGSCRFCGQMAQIKVHCFRGPEEKLDEAATELCGCAAAQNYVSRKKRMEKAKCTVERQFGKYLPKTAVGAVKNSRGVDRGGSNRFPDIGCGKRAERKDFHDQQRKYRKRKN